MGVCQAQLSQSFFHQPNRGFRVAGRTLTIGLTRGEVYVVLREENVEVFLKFRAKVAFDLLRNWVAALLAWRPNLRLCGAWLCVTGLPDPEKLVADLLEELDCQSGRQVSNHPSNLATICLEYH